MRRPLPSPPGKDQSPARASTENSAGYVLLDVIFIIALISRFFVFFFLSLNVLFVYHIGRNVFHLRRVTRACSLRHMRAHAVPEVRWPLPLAPRAQRSHQDGTHTRQDEQVRKRDTGKVFNPNTRSTLTLFLLPTCRHRCGRASTIHATRLRLTWKRSSTPSNAGERGVSLLWVANGQTVCMGS